MPNLVPITCNICGETYMRLRKRINVVLRNSGVWRCQACVNVITAKKNSKPMFSTRISAGGYVVIKTETGWMFEHVYVMEKIIGRKKRTDEAVHHKNGDKKDNRIENLELLDFGEHTRSHHIGERRSGEALLNIRNGVFKRSTTKLSIEKAEEIRNLHGIGVNQKVLAKLYSVSPMSVNRVVNNQSWNN